MVLKKGWSIFWLLYMFFFAVPFPMFLYYSINYAGGGMRYAVSLANPYLALTYLALSVVLWSWLLGRYFRQWVLLPVQEVRQQDLLLQTGMVRDAEVAAVAPTGLQIDSAPELEVTFRFHNLSGTPIHETLPVIDMRPEIHRFDVGKQFRLRINRDLTKTPIVVIDGSEPHTENGRQILVILGWLFVLGIVLAYYVYSYRYENQGTGWRFLTFFHPLLICPLLLLGMRWLVTGGIGKLFMGTTDMIRLKYTGHRADARLLEAKQTGTYVNEQPQVRFKLEYEDLKGVTHQTSFKKIVDLLEMDITRAKTIPIFYLAEQPQTVAFAADLDHTA